MRFAYTLLGLITLTNLDLSSGSTCSNGLPGVQGGDVCCPAWCSECSHANCFLIMNPECCVDMITRKCSEKGEAPCIIDDDVCCDIECVTCGGDGCDGRPGGDNSCCVGTIRGNGEMCSDTKEAPCLLEDVYCSNGVPGVEGVDHGDGVCCEAQCVTCGGNDCWRRPGGSDGCCTGTVKKSGVMCSDTMEAPCIISLNVDES